MILKLKNGDVKIELFPDVAPNHVKRIKELADSGKYDGVVFHRVIDGFMAQTGDVQFGNSSNDNFDLRRAGMGGSDLPDLKQEFNSLPHDRGTLSMARAQDPNSANSQFFICFKPGLFLTSSLNCLLILFLETADLKFFFGTLTPNETSPSSKS